MIHLLFPTLIDDRNTQTDWDGDGVFKSDGKAGFLNRKACLSYFYRTHIGFLGMTTASFAYTHFKV